MSNRRWTDEQDEFVITQYMDGMMPLAIGMLLGKTKASVEGRISVMKRAGRIPFSFTNLPKDHMPKSSEPVDDKARCVKMNEDFAAAMLKEYGVDRYTPAPGGDNHYDGDFTGIRNAQNFKASTFSPVGSPAAMCAGD